jgi:hypothetical protein
MSTNFFQALSSDNPPPGQNCDESFNGEGEGLPPLAGSYSESVGDSHSPNPEYFDSDSSRLAACEYIVANMLCQAIRPDRVYLFGCPVPSESSPDPVNFPFGVNWYCCTRSDLPPCTTPIFPV